MYLPLPSTRPYRASEVAHIPREYIRARRPVSHKKLFRRYSDDSILWPPSDLFACPLRVAINKKSPGTMLRQSMNTEASNTLSVMFVCMNYAVPNIRAARLPVPSATFVTATTRRRNIVRAIPIAFRTRIARNVEPVGAK
jgi:hypothetical protein